ncbi:MAG: SemiSWEET family transporter [Patescibacteria group bacterium]
MIELIGYTAAFLTASVMIPQIARSIRTKSVGDISFMMLALYITNTGLWVTYGVLIGAGPVVVADSFACCAGITQLIIKLKYNKL